MTGQPPVGDIFDPAAITLRPSTLVVEASAGTGKTTNIANVTVRAIAEGFTRIDQVLLVTFTVRAAAELRSRVHALLTECCEAVAARALPPGHLLAPALVSDPDLVQQRLGEAIANFDRATISTIHGFATRTLTELGVHADHDDFAAMGPPLSQMSIEIAEDLYLEAARNPQPGWAPPRLAATRRLVERSLEHPSATLTGVSERDVRFHLAQQARSRFEARQRTRQTIFFNDTITRLREALTRSSPDQPTNHAQELLRRRYRLVTIDEFQDTDLDQWALLRDAFDGHVLLLLIGDPKQSIYRFRGADVNAYLAASRDRDPHHLPINYRSTAAVAQGVAAILGGASLGRGIPTPAVRGVSTTALVDVPPSWSSPAQLRVMRQGLTPRTPPPRAFDHVCADLADHLVTLFTSPDARRVATIPDDSGRPVGRSRRLQRRDVAILVRTGYRARQVSDALARVGIGTIGAASTGVVEGRAGRDWHQLLTTLLDVRPETVRRAALTSLVGWTLPQLVAADDAALGELATTLRELSGLWAQRGMAVLSDAVMSRFSVHERLLEQPQGAELLSDLAQVAEIAHRRSLTDHLSADALLRWLADPPKDEVEHRLGSDEDLVQVMTIHGAKGLGFPIVCLPDLWYQTRPALARDEPRLGHDNDNPDGGLTLDISPEASAMPDEELAQEELRLAYVALTRAQSCLRVWWAPSERTTLSPLHRLLSHQSPGELPGRPTRMVSNADVTTFLDTLSAPRFAALTLTSVTPAESPATVAPSAPPLGAPRRWTRTIDQHWRRTSYSGLTAALHDLPPDQPSSALTQAVATTADEPDLVGFPGGDSAQGGPDRSPEPRMLSPMADIPGGAEFGTLVHAILEHVDPQASDLAAAIRSAAEPYLRGFGHEIDVSQLVSALVGVFDTPLGCLTGGTLRDLPASHRLAELDFEITMGSADTSGTVADLAALFSQGTLLDPSDPLASYGASLQATSAAEGVLRGFLNGSIDAVLRVPPGPGNNQERFVVVDYKTNTMPLVPGEVLTVGHYHAEAMAQAMQQAHYPLQALLYSVALHRYLKWSLPGYDPRSHLGGVGYLFVRGMAGPQTPVLGGMPAGVFIWRPGPEFILAADEVLGGQG